MMTIQAFWDVMPCRLANILTDSFKGRGVFANHLFFDCSTLKMEALRSFIRPQLFTSRQGVIFQNIWIIFC